jgi:hypothetical protein
LLFLTQSTVGERDSTDLTECPDGVLVEKYDLEPKLQMTWRMVQISQRQLFFMVIAEFQSVMRRCSRPAPTKVDETKGRLSTGTGVPPEPRLVAGRWICFLEIVLSGL